MSPDILFFGFRAEARGKGASGGDKECVFGSRVVKYRAKIHIFGINLVFLFKDIAYLNIFA